MQIFVLHDNPCISAQMLKVQSPIRANKQIVESMQAIANLCYKYSVPVPVRKDGQQYGKRNFPKPLMQWIECKENVLWLLENLKTINPAHASLSRYNIQCTEKLATVLPSKGLHFVNYAFSQAKGLDFRHLPVFEAYHQYLAAQAR